MQWFFLIMYKKNIKGQKVSNLLLKIHFSMEHNLAVLTPFFAVKITVFLSQVLFNFKISVS